MSRSIQPTLLIRGGDNVTDRGDLAVILDLPDVVAPQDIAVGIEIDVAAGALVVDRFAFLQQLQRLTNIADFLAGTIGHGADLALNPGAGILLRGLGG
jgi:hypothetical protein